MTTNGDGQLFGLVAEFEDADSLLEAAKQTRAAGYTRVSAYTPYYVEGLADTLEKRANPYPYVVPLALFLGALLGYLLQYGTSTITYELNVGGRPYVSWPAFMLITFEVGILVAGIATVVTLFIGNGLPLPHHPIFNAPNIEAASHSRFFLCIERADKKFNEQRTKEFLHSLEPVDVSGVQS